MPSPPNVVPVVEIAVRRKREGWVFFSCAAVRVKGGEERRGIGGWRMEWMGGGMGVAQRSQNQSDG